MECRKILEKSAEKKTNSSSIMYEKNIGGGIGGGMVGIHQQQQPLNFSASSSVPMVSGGSSLETITGITGYNGYGTLNTYISPPPPIAPSFSTNNTHITTTTTTTTTLVNNFTFKQPPTQSNMLDTFQPHLHDTQSIVSRSPYKMTLNSNMMEIKEARESVGTGPMEGRNLNMYLQK